MKATRKSWHCSIVKHYAGESLSSWCYRLCQIPDIQQFLLNNFVEMRRYEHLSFRSLLEFEPTLGPNTDFDIANPKENNQVLRLVIGKKFDEFIKPDGPDSPIIPWSYRRSYCHICVCEALKSIKAPILKFSWRQMLEPFCARHGVLLRDSPQYVGIALDAPLTIYKWHHSKACRALRYDEYIYHWRHLLAMSLRVQKKIAKLRSSSEPHCVYLIERSLISLIRALLMPGVFTYQHEGSRQLLEITSNEDETLYVGYHLQAFRASAASRARALFFIGILLGWISSSDAKSVLNDDPWAPYTAEAIWRKLAQFNMDLVFLLRKNLRIFSTPAIQVDLSSYR